MHNAHRHDVARVGTLKQFALFLEKTADCTMKHRCDVSRRFHRELQVGFGPIRAHTFELPDPTIWRNSATKALKKFRLISHRFAPESFCNSQVSDGGDGCTRPSPLSTATDFLGSRTGFWAKGGSWAKPCQSLNIAGLSAEISQGLAARGWYDAGERCITGA